MQDAKTGGSRWVPDIREDEITEFQEQNGDETATYKAVNVHPIISRVLDKLAFFRTHVSAVWYNKLANKTVKDKLDEIDTSINSLNSSLTPVEIDIETTINGIHAYRLGKLVFVVMENINRPAWGAGYIATGLPNPMNYFVAVGYKGTPFTIGDNSIYSDGTSSSGWESFATAYITSE